MAVNIKRKNTLTNSDRRPVAADSTQPHLFRWVLVALAVSAVLELLLWRTFSRIGVFIPKQSTFLSVYNVLSGIGRFVLTFSVIMTVIMLVLAVLRLREAGRFGQVREGKVSARNWPLIVAFVSIALVLVTTFSQLFPTEEVPVLSLLLRVFLIVSFAALAWDYWRSNPAWLPRLFIALLLTGYIVQLLAKILQDYLHLGNSQSWFIPLLMVGEAAVLVNGIALYFLYGGGGSYPVRSMVRNWPAFVGALVLTGVFVGLTFLTVAESDIVPILGLYALGYTMQLPLPMYVIALFFLLYTVFFNLGHLRDGKFRRAAAFGLLLIFTGGYLFNISNQYFFALAGTLLLARPELVEEWY